MEKVIELGLIHQLRNNKYIRFMLAPIVVSRNMLIRNKFVKSQDSRFIRQFKGKYEGKRCFIIGNGPSLTGEDLELIKGEISFACNRIYNIFDKTSWRPDFWMCVDAECLQDEIENIKKLRGPVKFVRSMGKNYYFQEKDQIHKIIMYDKFVLDISKHMKKNISTECHKYFSVSYTVTCLEIEFAIYMGFKEIYLLGVDHNYPISIDKNGKKTVDNNVKSHFAGGGSTDTNLHYIYLDAATQCYQVYRDYADAHGIRIYNATRGGKLEVFERVKLEDAVGKSKVTS